MFKLSYPSNSSRWANDLQFSSSQEYWKTLGYLSNPSIHKYYEKSDEYFLNKNFDMNIKYEFNSKTQSYSDTGRLYYYGNSNNEPWFKSNFLDLHRISKSFTDNIPFRINRKEFMETLEHDLGFIRIKECNSRDAIIIPEEGDIALQSASKNPNFNMESWDIGWNLGNY